MYHRNLLYSQKVEWGSILEGTDVELNANGTVKADPVTYQTDEPDIFVGGDVYTGQKFAIERLQQVKKGLCLFIDLYSHDQALR